MRTTASIYIALTLVSGAVAAEKQPSAKDVHDTRMETMGYARCVVRYHHDEAKTILLANSNNRDIREHHSEVFVAYCVMPEMWVGFPGDLLRYALAEALIRADFLSQGPISFADRLPLAHLPFPVQADLEKALAATNLSWRKRELQDDYDKARSTAAFSRYGECVARADPDDTRLWTLTEPDRPEEISRIRALMPALSQCTENGSTVKFGREQLRGAVALNYYRLANAKVQTGFGAVH